MFLRDFLDIFIFYLILGLNKTSPLFEAPQLHWLVHNQGLSFFYDAFLPFLDISILAGKVFLTKSTLLPCFRLFSGGGSF
jgi:hypothetical protein